MEECNYLFVYRLGMLKFGVDSNVKTKVIEADSIEEAVAKFKAKNIRNDAKILQITVFN